MRKDLFKEFFIKKYKVLNRYFGLILIISIFFTIISFGVTYLPYVFEVELRIEYLSKLKKYCNEHICKNCFYDNDFISKNFLLINTTNDDGLGYKNTIPNEMESENVQIVRITDRKKLTY